MKKAFLVLFAFICAIQFGAAQNFPHEFGKYSNEEFAMKEYPKDPSAEAVVIYDIGKSYFTPSDEGLTLYFERRIKIKIFNKSGFKWANFEIPYYEEGGRDEEITELKGNTYNMENGNLRITPLNTKNAFNEKINGHWFERKVAMPDVKEGSIVEISYIVRSPYFFNLRSWEFQNKIPVIYSEYTTKMCPFYEYTYILQGASKFDEFNSYQEKGLGNRVAGIEYQDMVYFFAMKDIPAFKDEAFITCVEDYIMKLDFQLCEYHRLNGSSTKIMTTWPKMIEELQDEDSFGKYIKTSKKKSTDILDTMKLATKTPLEKVKAIEHFVKSTYNWNEHNDKFASKTVKEFLSSKTGNSSDINLFMTGMLNAAGIEAYPVILSTRSHGKIKLDYPFQHFFNYTVTMVKLDSTVLLLDATEPQCNFSQLPTRCFNDRGLVIQKNKEEWVQFNSQTSSSMEYRFDIQLNEKKDSVQEKCSLTTTGYDAIDYRYRYAGSLNELKTKLLGDNNLKEGKLSQENLHNIDKPFEIKYEKRDAIEMIEDKIMIAPFVNTIITENPLKQAYRDYPIDFTYKKVKRFQAIINCPKGYKLLKKPDNLNINNKLYKIVYMSDVQEDGSIKIIGLYEFKKDTYEGIEYMDIKDSFDKIVDKFNEKLILVKI